MSDDDTESDATEPSDEWGVVDLAAGEDEEDADAWQLAEKFDQEARESGSRPDPELLDALAAVASDEILTALLGQLESLCADEDREPGDQYAAHLLTLAPRLGDDDARAVRAAVDVTTAELYVRTGDLAAAELRARRCEADLAELLPGLLGDREYVLGWLADEQGRTQDAHAHLAAARDLFAEDERWDEAAHAAEAAAQMLPTTTREVWDDCRRAAELHVTAGRPDEARNCVKQACERLAQEMAEPGTVDDSGIAALCTVARKLALDQGLPVLAARLGLAEAVYASESDVPWSDVVSRHEQSRREFAALDLDPVQQRAEVARVDLSLARAALVHGRGTDAEQLLSAALPGLRQAGLDGEAQMCEGMLLTVGAALRPASVDGPLAVDRFTDPDVRAGLLMTDGMRLAEQGRTDEALERLAESASVAGTATGPLKDLVTHAATAAVRAAAGDRSAVPAVLGRIDDQLADGSVPRTTHTALTQLAGTLRAVPVGLAVPDHVPQINDLEAAIAELYRLPSNAPERAERAADLVGAMVWGNPMGDLRRLRPLDDLLEIADGAVAETSQWIRTRTAGRLMSLMRALAERELPDPDVAIPRLDRLAAEAGDDPALIPLVASARWCIQVAQSVHHGDAGAVTHLSQDVQALIDTMPQDDPRVQPMGESILAVLAAFGAKERGDDLIASVDRMRRAAEKLPPGGVRAAADEVAAMMSSMPAVSVGGGAERVGDEQLRQLQDRAERPELGDADRAVAHTAVAMAALRGGQETDLRRVELGITHLRRAVQIAGPRDPQRVFHLAGLALGLYRRGELTNATDDLREAQTLLEEARDAAGGPGHLMWPMVNEMLSDVRRLLGEDPDGHKAALEGLRGHVWRVLAQHDLEGATVAVRTATADAIDTARRSLTANDPVGAITALDAGRGLALFAATTVGTFAERLVEAGNQELADRWRAAVAAGDPAQLPSDLRRAVLRTVTEHGSSGDLLDPPAYDEIQRALITLDADALVYLVPGAAAIPGFAVCAAAAGPARYLALPNLNIEDDPDITRYLTAVNQRDLAAVPKQEPIDYGGRDLGAPAEAGSRETLVTSVDQLCAWAWNAAMGPLIEGLLPRLSPPTIRRPQRLVLVPMGDLARIPWQAARCERDGTYAIELIAISQAVSARMLCRSAALLPVPPSPVGMIVGDPDAGSGVPNLLAARREAFAIRQVFYPGARYVGRRPDNSSSPSGGGTRAEVRAWLTASGPAAGGLLHLACHGFVQAAIKRPTAYLLLADGEKLFAEELIALMAQAPERTIGLAVLAACHTGQSMTGYDEAYSLGTAFLAAGVRSVLSTQWGIPDNETSVLMFMFHHYLRTEDQPPWAALRAAQLWMLNPSRVVPDEMPSPLREQLSLTRLDSMIAWAGFNHSGQ